MDEDFPRAGSRGITFEPRVKKPWPYTRITAAVLGLTALAVLAFAILFWYEFWRIPNIFSTNDSEENSASTMRPENGALVSSSGELLSVENSQKLSLRTYDSAKKQYAVRSFMLAEFTEYRIGGIGIPLDKRPVVGVGDAVIGTPVLVRYAGSDTATEPLALEVQFATRSSSAEVTGDAARIPSLPIPVDFNPPLSEP